MARHNRDGHGVDQRGDEYQISFQPDWLYQIKVTRTLESGRQSTKTLYRNAASREQSPGPKVRTRVTSANGKLDFELVLDDPAAIVSRIVVETVSADGEVVSFTIDDQQHLNGRSDDGD
jgi:hypothetical protein